MRVTQNFLFDSMKLYIQRNTRNLMSVQEQIATGKRINRASDDPIQAPRLMNVKSSQARVNQFLRNIERADSLNTLYDTTLGQAEDLLVRAKELLLAEANEVTSTPQTREAAQQEILSLVSQMVQIGNAKFDGNFIYSGFKTNTPAFADRTVAATAGAGNTGGAAIAASGISNAAQVSPDSFQIAFTSPTTFDVVNATTGNTVISGGNYVSGQPIEFNGLSVTIADAGGPPAAGDVFDISLSPAGEFQGDNGQQKIEVQEDTFIQQNLSGGQVFKGQGIGGVDVFDTLNRTAEALRTNDRGEIEALLDQLDAARGQIASQRSTVGSRQNLVDRVKARQQDIQFNLESLRSSIEDIDLAEAITNLERQQTAFEATLSASARISSVSLLDFLR